jgi:hypothetical protein
MALTMKRNSARLILLVMVALVIALFLVLPSLDSFATYIKTHLFGDELFTATAGIPYQLAYQDIGTVTVQQVLTNSSINSTTINI